MKEELYADFHIGKCSSREQVADVLKNYMKYYNTMRYNQFVILGRYTAIILKRCKFTIPIILKRCKFYFVIIPKSCIFALGNN